MARSVHPPHRTGRVVLTKHPDLFYENRYSHTRMTNPDFVKLSESMGAKALRCTNLAELPAMMKEFLEYDNTRPILMECLVSSEHVYPMVAAGKALHEQIVSPSKRASRLYTDNTSSTRLSGIKPSNRIVSPQCEYFRFSRLLKTKSPVWTGFTMYLRFNSWCMHAVLYRLLLLVL